MPSRTGSRPTLSLHLDAQGRRRRPAVGVPTPRRDRARREPVRAGTVGGRSRPGRTERLGVGCWIRPDSVRGRRPPSDRRGPAGRGDDAGHRDNWPNGEFQASAEALRAVGCRFPGSGRFAVPRAPRPAGVTGPSDGAAAGPGTGSGSGPSREAGSRTDGGLRSGGNGPPPPVGAGRRWRESAPTAQHPPPAGRMMVLRALRSGDRGVAD